MVEISAIATRIGCCSATTRIEPISAQNAKM